MPTVDGLMEYLGSSLADFARNEASDFKHARSLALELDRHWHTAKAVRPGPIDVIDMFSGCGGMSAGFLATNAVMPVYRLVWM